MVVVVVVVVVMSLEVGSWGGGPSYIEPSGSSWSKSLLPRVLTLRWSVQVENEYGFCGESKAYLRNLIGVARKALRDVVIFTTDPPSIVKKGSIAGDEVYT
jgi:hypothetical protein